MSTDLWRPATDGPLFHVSLLRFDGKTRESYQASLDERNERMLVLLAVASRHLEVDGFLIEEGDQIRQYFLHDEWFYIQEYHDSLGRIKGWYCNIGEPVQIGESSVTFKDLFLDIFVSSRGEVRVLDEDELRDKHTEISNSVLDKIHASRVKLIEMVEKRRFPFDRILAER